MNVGFIRRDNGACGYYRLVLPLYTMQKNNGTRVKQIEKGDDADKILEMLEMADIIVVPRMGEDTFVSMIPKMKEMGKKVVIDHDDNMFCVSPLSPHYEEVGTENVTILIGDEPIELWKDGKNINLERNRKRAEGFKEAMRLSDMVTVTQPILAEVYSEFNKNIKVLPNCVDMSIWQKLPLKKHEGIRLGWFGGSSHYEDWVMISDAVKTIMMMHPEVRLVLMGAKFEGTLKGIDRKRIEFHEWVHTEAYPYKAAILDLDLALIPLQESTFNSCKSSIKWVEMASLFVPCVTSYVSPYKELATEDNGIFIENNNSNGWIEGLSLLIKNTLLRHKIGGWAYRTVQENFDINKKWELWYEAYKELL